MFAQAVKKAREFTRPVVISIQTGENQLVAVMGACIIVNKEGWVLTANHLVNWYAKLGSGKQAFAQYEAAVKAIQDSKALLSNQKPKKIMKLGGPPKDSVIDFAFWWGQDGCLMTEAHVVKDADLALCKLENFDSSSIRAFPSFKNPDDGIDPGTSICRLGFPFQQVKHKYDSGTFTVDASDITFFPNEGIYTRDVIRGSESLIETSSPGLMGQSGGPLFDRNGTVWGIQSETGHLALGFSPKIPGSKGNEVEHQFLNVGRGAHPSVIVTLLQKTGVTFEML